LKALTVHTLPRSLERVLLLSKQRQLISLLNKENCKKQQNQQQQQQQQQSRTYCLYLPKFA
jgi:hypothetical protein